MLYSFILSFMTVHAAFIYSTQLPATADAHGGAHGGATAVDEVEDTQPHPPLVLILFEHPMFYVFNFYGAEGDCCNGTIYCVLHGVVSVEEPAPIFRTVTVTESG